MENDFSKVSLGFAEFVSQLLHETFDAVLSAQNYQLEKYSEFEKALSISNEKFKELYLSDADIKSKEIEIFGVALAEKMIISDVLIAVITGTVKDFDQAKAISNNTLTKFGFDISQQAVLSAIVEEKKGNLRHLINNSEMVRLMVDSGEITAKMELSNLYQNTANESTSTISNDPLKIPSTPPHPPLPEKKATASTPGLTPLATGSKIFDLKGIKVSEVLDPVSKQKTLLIDKSSIKNNVVVSNLIPKFRLVATPAQITSNSNLYSQVVIKFKTV
jgi:hypothetical protein